MRPAALAPASVAAFTAATSPVTNAVTRPLPTYLVAIDTGPFVHLTGTIPPDPERSGPMPYGAVATQAQKDKARAEAFLEVAGSE